MKAVRPRKRQKTGRHRFAARSFEAFMPAILFYRTQHPWSVSVPTLRKLIAPSILLCAGLAFSVPSAFASDNWKGAGVMAGGKGYAPTPMGQVNYRDIGPRNAKVPLLLIHQAWMSMVEFAEIQDELAKLGYRSIAVDTPGYGMSDPAPGQPTIRDLAENLLPVLDYLKIKKVIIVGHHTGSLLAASFAAHHPDRVTAVILHGSPFFTKEESAVHAVEDDIDRTPKADGSHVNSWFAHKFPGDDDSQKNLDTRTWMLINKFMMGPDIGHYAVYHYDMTADALAIRAPTLILTDEHDMIHDLDLRLAKLRPDFKYQVFSDYSGVQMMNEPKRWAEVAAAFSAQFEH
jgi:pimeloyl-ACP methyl ester carboxylesterase